MSSQKQPVLSVSSPVSVSESLAATVETLVSLNEEEFLTSLTLEDAQQLTEALETLTCVVGEDEEHLFVPLVDFIVRLLEKCGQEVEVPARRRPRHPRPQRQRCSAPENRLRVKLADLLPQKTEEDTAANAGAQTPRFEKAERPANRPRADLTEFLAQEAEHTAPREADTGPPVGKEVW